MRTGLVCVVALAALSVTGCRDARAGGARHAPAPIVVGALVSSSGRTSFIGQPEANTLRAHIDDLNVAGGIDGHRLELQLFDTRGEPDTAAAAARQLVANPRVAAIIGPSTTAETMAVVPVVEAARVPLMSLAAGDEVVKPVRPWVFKDAPGDTQAVGRIYDHLARRDVARVAIACADDSFGRGGEAALKEMAEAAGIRVVASTRFSATTPDSAALARFISDVKRSDAGALITWATRPGPAIVARLARASDLPQMLVFSHGIASREFLDEAGPAAEGILFPGSLLLVSDTLAWNHPLRAVESQYSRWYESRFHTPASSFGGHAWDALNLFRDGLNATLPMAGGEPSRVKLRAWLEETRNFIGTGGRYHFSPADHNGLGRDAFVMIRVERGRWTLAR